MQRSLALLPVIALVLTSTTAAHAGFEWVPPAEKPVAAPVQQPQQMQSAPSYGMAPMGQMVSPYPPMEGPAMTAHYPPAQQDQGYYAGAQAFANPVPPAPIPSGNANGLVINPYPLSPAGNAPSSMNTGSIEGAMLSESRAMNPLQLGAGLNTGGKARPMQPSVPAMAPARPQIMAQQPMMDMNSSAGMGGSANISPMPGFGHGGMQQQAAFAAPPVIQSPVAPLPPPVAAAPLAPPPSAQIPRAPVMQAPMQQQQYAPQPVAANAGAYSDAVGFGQDLPLALALSQVIPGDHALFFEAKVDAEKTNVSWQGGKPWNQVLQDMLAPLGLRAEIQPNLVMIRGA